jgi:DNA-binding NarL/FixJ family response regulator
MDVEARLTEARISAAWPAHPELNPDECVALDEGANTGFPLSRLWSDLIESKWKIVSCFLTDERCFLVLSSVPKAALPERRLSPRRVRVLERILFGEGQKAIALALRVAPSTVTLMAGECLRAMGLNCRSSRVPMMIVMAAHAHARSGVSIESRCTEVVRDGAVLRIVSAARPDAGLSAWLSPAECEVARLLIEGKRHAEIARLRDTSTRTIANQLAAAFHKLQVSGRAELLSGLVGKARQLDGRPVGVRELQREARLSRPDLRTQTAESLPAA